MAVLLTDLIEDIEFFLERQEDETEPLVSARDDIIIKGESARLILTALKRYENCDGKHQ